VILASFPSPSRSVWDLGPIPIRAYALCIIVGIIAAIWIGERRWVARGGKNGTVSDIAVWAVIFGLVGGRLYHVITDNELYFRAGRDPWRAFYVWEGGLGIWGAIALGGVGAWIGCRRRGIKLPPFADAVVPGVAVAQALGRWGNYFNQELFGRPTSLPWAVQIDPDRPSTVPGVTTYQPTFLYESIWDLALAGVLIWADRRFRMGRGRVLALYVMGYTAGRVWIEMLRIDTANHILGLRLNVWTSILVFIGGLIYFLLHPGPRETVVEPGMVPVGSDGEPIDDDSAAAESATVATSAAGDAGTTRSRPATDARSTTPTDSAAADPTAGDAEAEDDDAPAGAVVAGDDDPESVTDDEADSVTDDGPTPVSDDEPAPVTATEPKSVPEDEPVPVKDAEPDAEPAVAVAGTGPAGTGPVEAEPAGTGPVEAEPVEAEPAGTEPVEAEPVEAETVAKGGSADGDDAPETAGSGRGWRSLTRRR
jgi:prolipoprotein diacylglyceryl transferase